MSHYRSAARFGMLTSVIASSVITFGCGGTTSLSTSATDSLNPNTASVNPSSVSQIAASTKLLPSIPATVAVMNIDSPPTVSSPTVSSPTVSSPTVSTEGGALLKESNVTGPGRYIGSFRVPIVTGPHPYNWSGEAGWGGPGTVVWYNENGDLGKGSLIMAGRAAGGASYLTEISVPDQSTLDTSGNASSMGRAQFLVPAPYFFDLSAGRSSQTAPGDGNGVVSGGVFIADGNLYQNWGSFYQGVQTTATYFKKSGTDVTSGQTSGPFVFSSVLIDKQNAVQTTPIWYRGVVAQVPTEWQAALGGRYIQSQAEYSNSSPTGYGPALFSFDPRDIGAINPVPNQAILGYSPSNPIESEGLCSKHKFWTRHLSSVSGTVFPKGSSSVIVSASVGLGVYDYGTPGQVGQCGTVIIDPVGAHKGYHAYPYVIRFMAYNASELRAVKEGLKNAYDLKPYATWDYRFPGAPPESQEPTLGYHAMAYDSVNNRLFIIERETARAYADPLIHVYKLSF
jgi:hypothetical protein